MAKLHNLKRIVIKVGTSTLIYDTGKTNLRKMRGLVTIISDIVNSGIEVALVSSAAIGVGVGKLKLADKPDDTPSRQAIATIGQCELMFMYDKMFGEYGHTIGQLLITKDDVEDEKRKSHLTDAFEKLFAYGAVPIINENDAVAVEEIVYGDNDTLSAVVAKLIGADALVILTDIDGLYDGDPSDDEAKLIPVVDKIDDELFKIAGGQGSKFGTGGMVTKLSAAQIATEAGIDTVIMGSDNMEDIYKLLDGRQVGTFFAAQEKGQ